MKRTQKLSDIVKMRNPGCVELDAELLNKNMGKVNKTFLFTVGGVSAVAFVSGLILGKVIK